MNASPYRCTLLCLLAPFVVILPFLFWGYPYSNDFEFHMNSWADVRQQWSEGVFFPKWAAWANYGFGEPRFIFYPPASWMLGPAISLLLPWRLAPAVFIWLAVAIAGVSMFRLARYGNLSTNAAAMAAILYAANPYQLIVIYRRGAFSELLAAAMFPLFVMFVTRLSRSGRSEVAPLAMVFGGIWLISAPIAVIATYCGVLAAICMAVNRSAKLIVSMGAALLVGIGVAGFYIVPAAYEQQWVQIRLLSAPGLRPENNFLFSASPWASFPLNTAISILGGIEILIVSLGLTFTWPRNGSRELSYLLFAITITSVFLMLPLSLPLWYLLPKLSFVQFPWRWLVPLSTVFALVTALAVSQWKKLGGIAIAMFVLTTGLYAGQSHWRSQSHHIAQEVINRREGYRGTTEYTPLLSKPGASIRHTPEVQLRMPESVASESKESVVQITRWLAEDRAFTSYAAHPSSALLRLLNYPGWVAEVDGHRVPIASADGTGQAVIAIPAGKHEVAIHFGSTPDRLCGWIVSIGSSVVLLLLFYMRKISL